MEFIHCNFCGIYPFGGRNRFCLTSCGHVICEACARGYTCLICKNQCRLAEISAQSKPEVKALFMDGSEILKENVKRTVQVIQFQKQHVKSLGAHYKAKLEGYQLLQVECEKLKNDVDFLKRENEELKRKVESYEHREQTWIGCGTGNSPIELDRGVIMEHQRKKDYGAVGSGRPIFNFPALAVQENRQRSYSSMSTPNPASCNTPIRVTAMSVGSLDGGEYHFPRERSNFPFTPKSHPVNSRTPGPFISSPASLNTSSGGSRFLKTPEGRSEKDIVDRLRKLQCVP